MPTGTTHGWGIAGDYLSREIAKLPPIDGVTLHSVAGHHFAPTFADRWDRINIGYCFFESEIIAYRHIPEAARQWDHIVAGSSWCEHHLRIAGMERTSTILQGIDPAVFSPEPLRPSDGRFIVFSGGKFEFRKGHDLVIAAMRGFMQRHPDVWLACAWHNHWPMSIRTMEQSRLIDFRYQDGPCEELYLRLLADHGIPLERVLLYPVLDNRQMRQAYLASDLGLFPNRCEGGNNMVMCEYMACGRPVIASPMTGHRDVISADNAFCLTRNEPIVAVQDGQPAGVWFEASPEEAVTLLEDAYRDREMLQQLAGAAGESMRRLSWQEAARRFYALGQALAASDGKAGAQSLDAVSYFDCGQFDKAAQAYAGMLRSEPLNPSLHNDLATTLDRLGRYAEAVLHYEKALQLRPGLFEARYNLANSLKRLGKPEQALAEFERLVAERPDYEAAWQNLALCRLDMGDLAGAIRALEQACELAPGCLKNHADLGDLLLEQRRCHEALACFERALKINPFHAGVLNSKGVALQRLNDLDGAEECYRLILAEEPDNTLALNNLGAIMRARALPEQAEIFFDRALAVDPNDAKIIFNRGMARLARGNFEAGWQDYESRFGAGGPVMARHTSIPRWQGEALFGKTILVWCEQGYGDSIQFVRYLRLLADMGAEVVLEAQDAQIAPLLAAAQGVARVVLRGESVTADYQIPLLSLPLHFGQLDCPPQYLQLATLSPEWLAPLQVPDGRLKVGLTWAGRPTHDDDRNRSVPAELLEPLAHCSGVDFVNLQFGAAARPAQPELLDLTPKVTSFLDSAALVAALDLVVAVDTAVVHLAGALGVPVWILLPYNPDWRWLLHRSDTPWYASARLYRQQQLHDWTSVVDLLVKDLADMKKNTKDLKRTSRIHK